MAGVLGAPRSRHELEEAPGAYKDLDEVMSSQSDLVRVRLRLRPLAVIKG
jgi:tRNA-splicing ligase RtcB